MIAIFIPSLNRPHRLSALVENIHEATPEPHKIYFMVSDQESQDILKELKEAYFVDEGDTRYVTRMNKLYKLTNEPFMFMGSDDILFHKGWAKEALKVMDQGYDVVVGDDLFNRNGTMALIRRSYIQKQSGCIDTPDVLFYPGYQHNYADTEQFDTARKRNVFARALDSVVEHLHFGNGKSPLDETYQRSNRFTQQDQNLYESRKHLWEN